jgi:hypothetical protein
MAKHWLRLTLYFFGLYRCLICARVWLLHTRAERSRCQNSPLPYVPTEEGLRAMGYIIVPEVA